MGKAQEERKELKDSAKL